MADRRPYWNRHFSRPQHPFMDEVRAAEDAAYRREVRALVIFIGACLVFAGLLAFAPALWLELVQLGWVRP